MTDKEVLFTYRLQEAEETLSEAELMLNGAFSPRAIVNSRVGIAHHVQ